jgi:hypothetical protein
VIAADIARALGGYAAPSGWYRARCPVHLGDGDSLAVRDGARGLAVVCHAGCDRDAILAELRRLGILDDGGQDARPDPEAIRRQREADEARRRARIAAAIDLWEHAEPAPRTVVETYLWARLYMGPVPATIRLRRGMPHRESGERRPAMVCRVDHAERGLVGVHVTYLAPDGSSKASVDPPRRCIGPIGGGAVRLGRIRPDGWLVVGEGVETTLSVAQACRLPGWAALSAGGIERLILPAEARHLVIAGDHDRSGVGQLAAARAAARWRGEGRRVRIAIPPQPGSDWNDVALGRAPARIADHAA